MTGSLVQRVDGFRLRPAVYGALIPATHRPTFSGRSWQRLSSFCTSVSNKSELDGAHAFCSPTPVGPAAAELAVARHLAPGIALLRAGTRLCGRRVWTCLAVGPRQVGAAHSVPIALRFHCGRLDSRVSRIDWASSLCGSFRQPGIHSKRTGTTQFL